MLWLTILIITFVVIFVIFARAKEVRQELMDEAYERGDMDEMEEIENMSDDEIIENYEDRL